MHPLAATIIFPLPSFYFLSCVLATWGAGYFENHAKACLSMVALASKPPSEANLSMQQFGIIGGCCKGQRFEGDAGNDFCP